MPWWWWKYCVTTWPKPQVTKTKREFIFNVIFPICTFWETAHSDIFWQSSATDFLVAKPRLAVKLQGCKTKFVLWFYIKQFLPNIKRTEKASPIFFGKLGQTSRSTFGQIVARHQFSATSDIIWPRLRSFKGPQVGTTVHFCLNKSWWSVGSKGTTLTGGSVRVQRHPPRSLYVRANFTYWFDVT